MASEDVVLSVLKAATAAHKGGQLTKAESLYREALKLTHNPSPRMLLANLLLATAFSKQNVNAARKEAYDLAKLAATAIEFESGSSAGDGSISSTGLSTTQRRLLHTRYGYFLLQYAGYVRIDGHGAEEVPLDLSPEQRRTILTTAIRHLEAAAGTGIGTGIGTGTGIGGGAGAGAAVDATSTPQIKPDPLVWRNLALAYTSCDRLEDAERASHQCVLAAGGAAAPWEMHYKHGKALKRLGREAEALDKYCDAVEASKGHEMPMFWLRVADAGGAKVKLSAALVKRIKELLSQYGGAGGAGAGPGAGEAVAAATTSTASTSVPHEYIRKLFDGYARHFDEHLVGQLGYATPTKLLRLVLETISAAANANDGSAGGEEDKKIEKAVQACLSDPAAPPVWSRCADLGCGTGLAGVAFRPLVSFLAGVDLSGGMVAEARKRKKGEGQGSGSDSGSAGAGKPSLAKDSPLYELLGVGDISAWLDGQSAGGGGGDSGSDSTSEGEAAAGSREGQHGYDLLLAADVLVYIGDLQPVFRAASTTMGLAWQTRRQGRTEEGEGAVQAGSSKGEVAAGTAPLYFVFSTESLEAHTGTNPAPGTCPGYALTGTGRCVHARWYINSLAAQHGFTEVAAKREVIRQNAGKDVVGDLYVLQYQGAAE